MSFSGEEQQRSSLGGGAGVSVIVSAHGLQYVLKHRTSMSVSPEIMTLRGPYNDVACASTVEARKLEHQYPHALNVKYKGS